MENIKDLRLAVLIDADNVPSKYVHPLIEEITKYGTPTFKRIYADWTKPTVIGWKSVLLQHAITPVQQYSYTSGKNSTDSAMIIDAMDILYSGRVDGFCIVSSDSDFTRLATRLREAGMRVIGMGERKTVNAMISAVDKFIYLDILAGDDEPVQTAPPKPKRGRSRKAAKEATPPIAEPQQAPAPPAPPREQQPNNQPLIRLISHTINDLADEQGWAFLGDLGNLVLKKKPDFDPRNFGFKKLLPLIKSLDGFELDERETGKPNIKHVYVRNK